MYRATISPQSDAITHTFRAILPIFLSHLLAGLFELHRNGMIDARRDRPIAITFGRHADTAANAQRHLNPQSLSHDNCVVRAAGRPDGRNNNHQRVGRWSIRPTWPVPTRGAARYISRCARDNLFNARRTSGDWIERNNAKASINHNTFCASK